MSEQKPVLILGAMDEEILALQTLIRPQSSEQWNGFEWMHGTMGNRPVVLCKSGVGKVFAAMITQHLIDRFSVERVVFTGVAGAVEPSLEPGDIVVASRLVQHDLDVSALGFAIGHIPFTDYRYFDADPDMVKLALSVRIEGAKVVCGCVGTGDQFITDRSGLSDLELHCVDMEGCAVAQVCRVNRIPFLVIRIISDKADGSADIDFAKNLPRFANRSVKILERVLVALPRHP